MTSHHIPTTRLIGPISLGRPRWTNLVMAASVAIFWAGVILKILS